MFESFSTRLKNLARAIDAKERAPEIKTPKFPPLRARLFRLVKIERGIRKQIAFGLTVFEAEQLQTHIKRRLSRYDDPNDEGFPQFEITEGILEEIKQEAV